MRKVTKNTVKEWAKAKKAQSEANKAFYKLDKRLKALPEGDYPSLGIQRIDQRYLKKDADGMILLNPDLIIIHKEVLRKKVKV